MTELSVVHVTWLDSMSDSSWCERDQIGDVLHVTHTVGFKIKENENSIVIALSFDPETDSVNCFKYIPLVAIQSVKTLCKIKIKK